MTLEYHLLICNATRWSGTNSHNFTTTTTTKKMASLCIFMSSTCFHFQSHFCLALWLTAVQPLEMCLLGKCARERGRELKMKNKTHTPHHPRISDEQIFSQHVSAIPPCFCHWFVLSTFRTWIFHVDNGHPFVSYFHLIFYGNLIINRNHIFVVVHYSFHIKSKHYNSYLVANLCKTNFVETKLNETKQPKECVVRDVN